MLECSGEDDHLEPRCNYLLTVFTCVLLAFLTAITLFGNFVTTSAFFKLKHTVNNVLFLNLGFTYTVVASIVQPYSIYLLAVRNLIEPNDVLSNILCQVAGGMFEVAIYSSLLCLASVSLDRFAIVFFPLKYKSAISQRKIYILSLVSWMFVFVMIVPVVLHHTIRSKSYWVYSTHNSTTVCQGRYWYLDEKLKEVMSDFQQHAFVHIVAIMYLICCLFSLVPNVAVIFKLNQAMYKLNRNKFERKSSSLLTVTAVDSNNSLSECRENVSPTLPSPMLCYHSMKANGNDSDQRKNDASENAEVDPLLKTISSAQLTKPDTLYEHQKSDSNNKPEKSNYAINETDGDKKSHQVLGRTISRQYSDSRTRFRSSIRKVSNASTFIMRDKLSVKRTKQSKLRKRRQRSIVTTLIIMCMVGLLSTGLYGMSVFTVNLHQHNHGSWITAYFNFFAPFLIHFGMCFIPIIHYWRNIKLRGLVNNLFVNYKDRLQCNKNRATHLGMGSRVSRIAVWVPIHESSATILNHV